KNFIKLKKNDQVTEHVAGTVIWTAGIESSEITSDIAKEVTSGGRGRIQVDENLRSVDHENVYVIGDNMLYTAPGEERPVPQMVENAEHSAATVAKNIVATITKSGEMEAYNPKFHGVMVCVGGRYGVARGGLAKHQINFASFFAMFAKHFINIIYFIQVMGWAKVFSYLKHEFFTIRNKRSFLGGHFSNRTPSFMLVPLRLWLGAVWVYEGVMKIVEGWLTKPMLSGFFGGANSWFDSLLGRIDPAAADAVASASTEVAEAADAVASASTAVAGAADAAVQTGTVIFDWNFKLFETILVSGKALAESTISDIAFKIQVPFVDWFVENVVLGTDTMTMFMQIFIVVLQILIGLGLMGGCFTFLSAIVSLVLQVMFVTTTGLYLNTFWMIFAGLALVFGGGYTLGIDYYLMPFLKKKWQKVKWARKWYLYND
ncbi:MAG: FAD-dependent oxidoreductase, partial [Lachnospiraceae bacterium]|nr:FAD-dependent oxidoreductase [Lachnospiraceae bacterium]